MQELLVVVTEALAEHHAADHVGHGAAQQEYWVKRLAWRRRGKHSRNPLLKNTNERKKTKVTLERSENPERTCFYLPKGKYSNFCSSPLTTCCNRFYCISSNVGQIFVSLKDGFNLLQLGSCCVSVCVSPWPRIDSTTLSARFYFNH